jgi:DNA-binding MarR family transcriptional regulator
MHASSPNPGYVEGEPARNLDEAADNAGAQSWRNLLRLDAEIFAHRGIRMLTPEARVLINLKLSGPMSVTAAMELAGVSYRGFYAVLDRLKQAGLVDQVKDQDDQRVRNLHLDPATPISSAGP